MKVVPEILSRTEMGFAKINGIPWDLPYGIVFDSEQEASEYKEMLEELMAKKLSTGYPQ